MRLFGCNKFGWAIKINNFVKQKPFLILQNILYKIPGHPVRVALFFMLELCEPITMKIRGVQIVREGTPADVPGMCLLENKESLFMERFKEGEFCAVSVHGDQISGYGWFSDKAFHLEDRFKYRIDIPDDAIYSYDGFIKREYRLRGGWPLLMKYVQDQARSLGRSKVICMIDYGNDPSLKAHIRLGYSVYLKVIWIKILTKSFFIERTNYSRMFKSKG